MKLTYLFIVLTLNYLSLGDIVILFLIQNILIFCVIFWLLTWAGEFFYKKKNHFSKRNFYECGFKSTSDVNIQINFNFSMICVFLILYDVEFTLLIPVFFNLNFIIYINFILILLFIVLILLSLVYDWQMNSLNWQY